MPRLFNHVFLVDCSTTPASPALPLGFGLLSWCVQEVWHEHSSHTDVLLVLNDSDSGWDGALLVCFGWEMVACMTCRFVSKMFHPNIYADGGICLDILQNQWSPIYDISAILTSIQSLLTDPNPNSPANSEAARLYAENRREYNRRVKEVVEQSWAEDEA